MALVRDTIASDLLDASIPYQVLDFLLPQPLTITGIRLSGVPGGTGLFANIAELDGLRYVPHPEAPAMSGMTVAAAGILARRRWAIERAKAEEVAATA